MKAVIWIDWVNQEVYTCEDDIEKKWNIEKDDIVMPFDEWLDEQCISLSAVWYYNDEDKNAVIQDYSEYLDSTYNNWRKENFEEIEINI